MRLTNLFQPISKMAPGENSLAVEEFFPNLKPVLVTCLALMLMAIVFCPCALAADEQQIYLDEPMVEPEARIVKQETVKGQYEDGKPRIEAEVAYLSDELVVNHGKFIEYYRSGQKFVEGEFEKGLHSGQWQYWHANGKPCKTITFKNGKPNGQWDVFRDDGTREATKQYQEGLRQGEWIRYFADGEQAKVKMSYVNGKNEGDRITYFESGQKRQHLVFKEGLMDGVMTNWNEAGEKTTEVEFEAGKVSGKTVRNDKTKEVN